MMMQIVGSFAEFERAMLRERSRSGLKVARKQGRIGGHRPKLKANQQQEIVHMVSSGQKTPRMPPGYSISIHLLCRVCCNVKKCLNRVLRSIAP